MNPRRLEDHLPEGRHFGEGQRGPEEGMKRGSGDLERHEGWRERGDKKSVVVVVCSLVERGGGVAYGAPSEAIPKSQ